MKLTLISEQELEATPVVGGRTLVLVNHGYTNMQYIELYGIQNEDVLRKRTKEFRPFKDRSLIRMQQPR